MVPPGTYPVDPRAGRGHSGTMAEERTQTIYVLGASAVAVFAVAAIALRADLATFNFRIYSTLSWYFVERGHLAAPDVYVNGVVAGSYADFTPMNLRVYSLLLGTPGRYDPAVYIGYQAAVLLIGIALVWVFRRRLLLSDSDAMILVAGAIVCAAPLMLGFEDKMTFFTLTIVALLCARAHPLAAGASLGLLAGWTGLGVLALPFVALRRPMRDTVAAAAAFGAMFAGLFFVAGGAGFEMLSNRADRAARAPFWFSIWHLAEPLYGRGSIVFVLFGSTAALTWLYLNQRVTAERAILAVVLLNLMVLNDTVPTRFVMLLPLGVVMFSSSWARLAWVLFVAVWSIPVAGLILGWSDFLADPWPGAGALHVIYVNGPILVLFVTLALQGRSPRPSVVQLSHRGSVGGIEEDERAHASGDEVDTGATGDAMAELERRRRRDERRASSARDLGAVDVDTPI